VALSGTLSHLRLPAAEPDGPVIALSPLFIEFLLQMGLIKYQSYPDLNPAYESRSWFIWVPLPIVQLAVDRRQSRLRTAELFWTHGEIASFDAALTVGINTPEKESAFASAEALFIKTSSLISSYT